MDGCAWQALRQLPATSWFLNWVQSFPSWHQHGWGSWDSALLLPKSSLWPRFSFSAPFQEGKDARDSSKKETGWIPLFFDLVRALYTWKGMFWKKVEVKWRKREKKNLPNSFLLTFPGVRMYFQLQISEGTIWGLSVSVLVDHCLKEWTKAVE